MLETDVIKQTSWELKNNLVKFRDYKYERSDAWFRIFW